MYMYMYPCCNIVQLLYMCLCSYCSECSDVIITSRSNLVVVVVVVVALERRGRSVPYCSHASTPKTLAQQGLRCATDFLIDGSTALSDWPSSFSVHLMLHSLLDQSSHGWSINLASSDHDVKALLWTGRIDCVYAEQGLHYYKVYPYSRQQYILTLISFSVSFSSLQVPDSHSTIVVEFLSRFAIENPQQTPVTLYDYYDPGIVMCF